MLCITREGKKALIVLLSIGSLLVSCLILYFAVPSGCFFPSAPKFDIKDISYNSANELKINLEYKEREITSVIKELKTKYYDTDIIRRKVNNYELYLADMNTARFPCKETKTHGVCPKCSSKGNRNCSTCEGKIIYFKEPCLCKGSGVLTKNDLN